MRVSEAEARLGVLGLDLLTNWPMMGAEDNCRGHGVGTDSAWGPDRLEGREPSSCSGSAMTDKQLAGS